MTATQDNEKETQRVLFLLKRKKVIIDNTFIIAARKKTDKLNNHIFLKTSESCGLKGM